MPVKSYESELCGKRFDFGVPLEDVFPQRDIHPRLKYIFNEAYRIFVMSQKGLEAILAGHPNSGFLSDCMKLKETLTYDVDYHYKSEYRPQAYFWLLKHFLEMLPIRLLPEYSELYNFDWQHLSNECRDFFNSYEKGQKNYVLEHSIAKNLNYLPREHFLLLNSLIIFLRKVSQKSTRSVRIRQKSLFCVTKYYCSSIYSSSYTQGHKMKEDAMLPLLTYLILRWRQIRKLCLKREYCPSIFANYDIHGHINVDYTSSKPRFTPADNVVYSSYLPVDNVNYIIIPDTKKIYLKDSDCQTELSANSVQSMEQPRIIQSAKSTSDDIKIKPIANSTIRVEEDVQVNETGDFNLSTQPCFVTAADFTQNNDDTESCLEDDVRSCSEEKSNSELQFFSFENLESKQDWQDIMTETKKTVKKLDEYIYDDYETFKSEDFNQIGVNLESVGNSRSSLYDRISKIGWTYTPPKNLVREPKETTISDSVQEHSYVKFDEVDSRSAMDADDQKDWKSLSVVFRQSEKLDKTETSMNSRSNIFFRLKRFKISLGFLRVLKREERPRLIFENNSKVKYIRMKHFKANTL